MTTPNLFIVGAPRCGTTSMASYLGRHPEVHASAKKEPMFHATDLPVVGGVEDRDRYLGLFAGPMVAYRMEASPWYLYSVAAAASIAQMSPESRIIIQLRDPTDAIVSLHTHHRFVGLESEADLDTAVFDPRPAPGPDFRTSLDYLAVARFSEQIDRYMERFPSEQVHFVLLEDLSRDPQATHLATLRFLELSEIPLREYRQLNPRRQHRSDGLAKLTSTLGDRRRPGWQRAAAARIGRLNTTPEGEAAPRAFRRKVIDRLGDDINRLESRLDRDLSPWRAP